MNAFMKFFGMMLLTGYINSCQDPSPDSISKAKDANKSKTENSMKHEEITEFLIKIADARMMGIEEGKEAMQKGTKEEIRNYGSWMIQEQSKLQEQVKLIADSKGITLPANISKDKQDGLEDLQEKTGTEFDKKFMKMMIIDHKRDLKDFKKAQEYKDQQVASFASKYLAVIQSHLDKIEQIEENYSSK
ncbi:MAG: DUF4142 domain-containing protein [Chitinophagaceae bacterium]|nr:DUF4142 domain-containing protein [Chitinophagaceae bacterium]